jgi:hypothetical protein
MIVVDLGGIHGKIDHDHGIHTWRSYMRRATSTLSYSGELPLAQGVDVAVS